MTPRRARPSLRADSADLLAELGELAGQLEAAPVATARTKPGQRRARDEVRRVAAELSAFSAALENSAPAQPATPPRREPAPAPPHTTPPAAPPHAPPAHAARPTATSVARTLGAPPPPTLPATPPPPPVEVRRQPVVTRPEPSPRAAAPVGRAPRPRRARRLLPPLAATVALLGLALIVAGITVVARPLIDVLRHGGPSADALAQWRSGGAQALRGMLPSDASPDIKDVERTCGTSSTATEAYALVTLTFTDGSPPLAGVAGDGLWDMLQRRSMVHYQGSANPGQHGNLLIAFHREPNYERVDHLSDGDFVYVEDRQCHTYRYRVIHHWDLPPDAIDQLAPTTGQDLTLVTCTPWQVDSRNLVWRAVLDQPPLAPA